MNEEDMELSNNQILYNAFEKLRPWFAAYVCYEIKKVYGDEDWITVARNALSDHAGELSPSDDYFKFQESLDIPNCIRLMNRMWSDVFGKKLSLDYKTWANELMGVRIKVMHAREGDLPNNEYTYRALDTMALLCEPFDDATTTELRKTMREFRKKTDEEFIQSTQGKSKKSAEMIGIMSAPLGGLPAWREVMEPHPDVAQGRYRNAEFAADLSQVANGKATAEYQDPVEFFSRTYLTEGIRGLLVQALQRVSGKGGEPVLQLKTAFGGGKTHSMLALYHLLRGKVASSEIPNIKPVMEEAGVSTLPRANVAVLVGTKMDPTTFRNPAKFPGIRINTIWGEMAAQLAESAGNMDLYEIVRESDRKHVSPGSDALRTLLDAAGPCLILIDELVAYGKKIHGSKDLPAGTFDNFITFIQELTEAARASKNSLVVASLPESDIEIGGEGGRTVLETIEHTFGRMEAIWKPVAADEGFEVVRRRLFLNCKDEGKRDLVCNAFSRMYNENSSDFPAETKELAYRERMRSCYPIHPEVFDRLYEDWATLERFQRTRGVLRLMAAVIHELWMGNDAAPMIMPGSVALSVPAIRDELTRHLSEGWNGVIDREVDGKNSIPYQTDQVTPRYGVKLACRRVARTIMMGSAPTSISQTARGIEKSRILLGTVMPGESPADFNDARSTLQSKLAYLYTNTGSTRFWYDTRPTLRKTAEDRAVMQDLSSVDMEIETRLKKLTRGADFAGVHFCPKNTLDVPDEKNVRLVVLPPSAVYRVSGDNPAKQEAEQILNYRGTAPRLYRNMLIFLAADKDALESLRRECKYYLAWSSIRDDKDSLNLDQSQLKETDNNLKMYSQRMDTQINETWCRVLAPISGSDPANSALDWDENRISGGDKSPIIRTGDWAKQNEHFIPKWAPALLLMELDNLLWKDKNEIQIRQLWDYLTRYCYLPRLRDYSVLEQTIREGLNSTEFFALASGYSEDRYVQLRYNQPVYDIHDSDYLVRVSAATKQLATEKPAGPKGGMGGGIGGGGITGGVGGGGGADPWTPPVTDPVPPVEIKDTVFNMSARLDPVRVNKNVQQLMDEVINHLSNQDGCEIELRLEVRAVKRDGFDHPTVRTVNENCRTLHVDDYGFEK